MDGKLIDITLEQALWLLGIWAIGIPLAIIILFNLSLIIGAFIRYLKAKINDRRANP